MWKCLLNLLFGPFVHHVVGGEGGPGDEAEGGDGNGGDEGSGNDDDAGEGGESEGGADEQDEGAGDTRAENIAALRKARREEEQRRIAAEARAQALQEELDRGRRGAPRTPAADDDETPPANETETQRFVRVGNKTLKTASQASNAAVAIAQDAADKAEFYNSDDPLVKKYKKEVEAEVLRMAKEGQRAPREAILTFLVGKKAREAAQTAVGKKQKDEQRAAAGKRVDEARGKPAATPRSDRTGKEKQSERDARRARLENLPI